MPAADIHVTADLVRELLHAQHPDLAELALVPLAHGWDNELFRLGETYVVRMPRRSVAAELIEHELAWVPVIAPYCSLPVPVPVRRGRPGDAYPYSWSIVPYLPGYPVAESMLDKRAARSLGEFVRRIHVPAPPDAPRNPIRGIPLAGRADRTEQWFAALAGRIDTPRVRRQWLDCLAAPTWDRAPVWLHGDIHTGNVLWDGQQISGVVDFGDITAGDPATDLAIAWMCFDDDARAAFLDESGADEAAHLRGRGWAITIALGVMASDDTALARIGERMLACAT